MRSLIITAAVLLALPCSAAQADDSNPLEALSCPRGVLFKSLESGALTTVIRQGFGKAFFTMEKDQLQPAAAAELKGENEGEHAFIYGPSRSYMFLTDEDFVKDFTWRPAETDPNAFYTVRTDDGDQTRFTLVDVGCAP
ncbi:MULTISPECIES: hypothetical protein [unclassified Mesorhizobium]|uniref:hypothetical protein n=1 Tax=unclassified Mesorhizobium TaxID=325217 RepID=UPI00112BA8AA|nr:MULTISPECIES: hypothetical protein [unclassified Mesorhizobium]TPL00257.1 hypothetical protein FJ567_14980 [Mesorhizobium sp. B2-4-16]TPL66303.1 hypothetical protein FJ956_20065 [Mesorhizobium sp. B2-4-3]